MMYVINQLKLKVHSLFTKRMLEPLAIKDT